MREIPVELQKLFARLLLLDQQSSEVNALTTSFGWNSNEVKGSVRAGMLCNGESFLSAHVPFMLKYGIFET